MRAEQVLSIERRARAALLAGDADAGAAAIRLLGSDDSDRGTIESQCEALERLIPVVDRGFMKASPVVAEVRWRRTLLLERLGRLDAAFAALEEFDRRGAVTRGLDADLRRRTDLSRCRLLFYAGKVEESRVRLAGYVDGYGRSSDPIVVKSVAEARWLQRIVLQKTATDSDPITGDAARAQVMNGLADPDPLVRTVAAQAGLAVVSWAMRAQNGFAVFDIVSELEDAFAGESDRQVLLALAWALLRAGDWLWGAEGAFLQPEGVPRSELIARSVINRLEGSEGSEDRYMLARARWVAARALGAVGGIDDEDAELEELLAMGSDMADALGDVLAEGRDRRAPETRGYEVHVAVIRAAALERAGRRDDALEELDALIERYESDESELVRSCLEWGRQVRDEIAGSQGS